MKKHFSSWWFAGVLVGIALVGAAVAPTQQLQTSAVVRLIDTSVKNRTDNIARYTVTEHYSVYRNKDEVHPAAEMTVNTTYQKDLGKSYKIISQSGSEFLQNLVLSSILENEKNLNRPGVREGAWITSANYTMKLNSGATQALNGRDCLILSLTPRRKTPYLVEGTVWVDSKDGSIVQVQGTTAKSATVFSGRAQIVRQYADINGASEAIHFRAVSNSMLFGQTIVTIDYLNYQVQLIKPM